MNKLKKYLISGILAVFAIVFFTACGDGSDINTTLTLNEDLSGERVMVVAIDSSNFGDYFSGDFSDLISVCEAHCPSEMTFTSDSDALTITFTLAFSSISDYNTKVTSIIGYEEDDYDWVIISTPDTVWASGIYVDEGFGSEDLLTWLSDALVDEGYVSSSNSSSIFSYGDTEIIYKGESYTTSSTIYLNEVESLSLENVDILTEVTSPNTYNRSIIFYIPESSMESKGDEIDSYMNSLTPSNASLTTDEDNSCTLYIYSANDLTSEGLSDLDQAIFGEAYVLAADLNDTPFIIGEKIYEEFSLDNFLDGSSYIYCNFYVKIDSGLYATNYSSVSSADIASTYSLSDTSLYEGYYCVDLSYAYAGSTTGTYLTSYKIFSVADVAISSSHSLTGKSWNRTTTITLANLPSEDEQALLLAAFEELIAATNESDSSDDADEESDADEDTDEEDASDEDDADDTSDEDNTDISYGKISVSGDEKDDTYVITITQKGSCEEVMNSSLLVFGEEGYINYTNDSGLFTVRKQELLIETIYLYNLLTDLVIDENYKLTYTTKLGLSATPTTDYAEYVSGSTYTLETTDTYISARYIGTYVDILSVLLIVFILAGVALIAFVAFKFYKANKPAMVAPAPTYVDPSFAPQQGAAPAEGTVSPAGSATVATPAFIFCTNCGEKLESDSNFCPSCGTKAE